MKQQRYTLMKPSLLLGTLVAASSASSSSASLRSSRGDDGIDFSSPALEQGMVPNRQLAATDNSSCVDLLLLLSIPAPINDWNTCIKARNDLQLKEWKKPLGTVAGAIWENRHHCWCEKKMQAAMEPYGCCLHRGYKDYCEADCAPDCNSAPAQKCVKECNARCLEKDYRADICEAGCKGCVKYYQCIADHGIKQTLAGSTDHAHICNDAGLDKSTQWKAWKDCYNKYPKRTHWHRHNAEDFCYCQSDMKTAATSHGCCNANWGKEICDSQCTDAKNINCTSTEALECSKTCNKVCGALYTTKMSDECNKTCFQKDAKCSKYSVCKPGDHYKFGYTCETGKAPLNNGCCPKQSWLFTSFHCPSLCAEAWAHYPSQMVAGYAVSHGLECECTGCPNSTVAATAKWAATLAKDLDTSGQTFLASTCKDVGILGPNRKMQELMKERNEKIITEQKLHKSGQPDAEWDKKAKVIVDKYNALIITEAKAFKARGETDEATNAPADSGTCADPDPNTAGTAMYVCPAGYVVKLNRDSSSACTSVTECNKNCCDVEPNKPAAGGTCADPDPNTAGTTAYACPSSTHLPRLTANPTGKCTAVDECNTNCCRKKRKAASSGSVIDDLINVVTNLGSNNQQSTATSKKRTEGKKEDKDSGSTTIVIIVAALVIGVLLISIIGLLMYVLKMRASVKSQIQQNQDSSMPSLDGGFSGDSNVVMGRPVDNPDSAVAGGAPMARADGKGKVVT